MATIRQALADSILHKQQSDSWQLDAQLLLAHVLRESREHLFTWPDRELSAAQLDDFATLCARRSEGEPVAYLVGRQAFWDFELMVNAAVLIPRPETELLVERAIAELERAAIAEAQVLDLGTGSGAIALAIAAHNVNWHVTAVDFSEAALAVARQNAELLGIENIEFEQSSWCDDLGDRRFDLICANPPYVEEGDAHLSEGSLPFEPSSALVAKDGGLADLKEIAQHSSKHLIKGGLLLLEHGYQQKLEVEKLLQNAGYKDIECLQDLAGLDRTTIARLPD